MMFYINKNTQMGCANFFCWLTSKMGPISVARGARRRSLTSKLLAKMLPWLMDVTGCRSANGLSLAGGVCAFRCDNPPGRPLRPPQKTCPIQGVGVHQGPN